MKKNLNIQGLRCVCAIMVFLSHALFVYQIGWLKEENPLKLLIDGHVAVCIFFVLSGFFYYKSPCSSFEDYKRVVRNRLIKITPPYLIALTVGFVLCNFYVSQDLINRTGEVTEWWGEYWREPVPFTQYLKEASMFFVRHSSIDNPAWYVFIDVKVMLVMPWIVVLFRKIGWKYSPILVLLTASISDLRYLSLYIMGALLHHYIDYVKRIALSSKLAFIMLLIISLLLLDVEHYIFTEHQMMRLMWLINGIGASILVGLVVTIKDASFLSNKIFVWLGGISYEFYICHAVILSALLPFVYNVTWFIILSFFVSILFAYGLNRINHTISTHFHVVRPQQKDAT